MSAAVHVETYGDRYGQERAEPEPSDLDDAVHVFLAERTRLLRISHRIVGDSASAEDVVQEAWVRWQRVDRRQIKNPAAFLTTATTHLAINLIQSARHRHELPTETSGASIGPSLDPTDAAASAVAIERMLGFLMAKLSPPELAAFILRKCFDYPYQDIAGVLGTSACNVRQLVRRSRLSLTSSRVRRVDIGTHRRLVAAFAAATGAGELEALVGQLVKGVIEARSCPAAPKLDTRANPSARPRPSRAPSRAARLSRHTKSVRLVDTKTGREAVADR